MKDNPDKISSLLRNKKGYMLIEALIAIAIFSVGFMAVATLVFSSSRNNINGNILTQANMFAREKMEELKGVTNLSDLDKDEAPEPVGGIFTRSWTASDPLTYGTSREIQVTVSWVHKGQNRSVVMKTITRGNGI
jgi:type II secretory pathway pseudopilin PulG